MKPAERALFEAIASGKAEVVAQMIKADKELLSAVDDESAPPLKGDSPVYRACRIGNITALNIILEINKNEAVHKHAENGLPPIFVAVAKKHFDVVKRLIAAGVDVNVTNPKDNNYTPLFWAVKLDSPQLVQILIDGGANMYACSTTGSDAISLAKAGGNKEVIAVFANELERREKVNQAKLKDLERQQLEVEKKNQALAARNENLRAEMATAKALYTQDQLKHNTEFAQYSLDVYKTAVVDGNMGPLPKFVPSSVTASKTNQAYADAQRRQAQDGAPAQAAAPGMKPG